jgi:hypothetical protein
MRWKGACAFPELRRQTSRRGIATSLSAPRDRSGLLWAHDAPPGSSDVVGRSMRENESFEASPTEAVDRCSEE